MFDRRNKRRLLESLLSWWIVSVHWGWVPGIRAWFLNHLVYNKSNIHKSIYLTAGKNGLSCRGRLGVVSKRGYGHDFKIIWCIIIRFTQIDLLDHQEKSAFRVYILHWFIKSESHFGVHGFTLIFFRSFGVNNILD